MLVLGLLLLADYLAFLLWRNGPMTGPSGPSAT